MSNQKSFELYGYLTKPDPDLLSNTYNLEEKEDTEGYGVHSHEQVSQYVIPASIENNDTKIYDNKENVVDFSDEQWKSIEKLVDTGVVNLETAKRRVADEVIRRSRVMSK